MSENLKTTYVSQLDEMTGISADDLILVSKWNESKSSAGYASKKISYGTLSSILLSGIDDKIANGIDNKVKDLSDAISANYDSISVITEKEKSCESAIIKVANCVNQAKHDIQFISSEIHYDLEERQAQHQQLCNAIYYTSSYLSVAVDYVSGQVNSKYRNFTENINYLSTQHGVLSTQLSNQITSKILQLSSCISSNISALSDKVVTISGELDSTIYRVNDLESDLRDLTDQIEDYDYDDDINALSFHMFNSSGNVGNLCSDIEDIKERLDNDINKYVKFYGIFDSFDDIGNIQAEMKEGDIIVVGDIEYYLDANGSLQAFGSETSAQYWNDTCNKVNLSVEQWNEMVDNNLKIQILNKSELTNMTDIDDKTIYFCTDE